MHNLLLQLQTHEADRPKNQNQSLVVIEYTAQDLERKIKKMNQCLKKLSLSLLHLLLNHIQPPTADLKV